MEIEIFPRIHLSLIAMHSSGYRKNGGIGFATNGFSARLKFTPSKQPLINDFRKYPLGKNESLRLITKLKKVQNSLKLKYNIIINITGTLRAHVGMGSGTSITLACIEGLLRINSRLFSEQELVKLSGRGGTSGVGINTYFHGGLSFDIGHKSNSHQHLPSSKSIKNGLSLNVARLDMPDWPLSIIIPSNIAPKTQQEEISFFRTACPINEASAHKILYECLFGIYASVHDSDIDTFCSAISKIQSLEWKKKERGLYGSQIDNFEKILTENSAKGVGMSSLGPLIFFINAEKSDFKSFLGKETVIHTTVRNKGRYLCE